MAPTLTLAALTAALAAATDEEHEAYRLATRQRASVKAAKAAASEPLSAIRAAGAFTCGVVGHGKRGDGHFATAKGFEFHLANTKHA